MNRSRLVLFAFSAVLGAASLTASAAPTVQVTGVGTRTAGGALQMGTGTVDIGNNRSILITGFLADVGPRDVGRSGRVILESQTDQSQWAIPFVNRLWGAHLALTTAGGAKLDAATANGLAEAGFLAAADAYTLPPGTYTVKSVVAIFGTASVLTVPVSETMAITIPSNRTTTSLALTAPGGATVNFTPKIIGTTGDIRLSEYGIQRSGAYQLSAPAFDKWGREGAANQFTLNYQRPVLKFAVENPSAQGFEGFMRQFGMVNPLTTEKMSGEITAEATMEPGTGATTASLNGVSLAEGQAKTVTLEETPGKSGAPSMYGGRAAANGEGAKVKLFVQKPDAPDLEFAVANWDPDKAINVAATKPTFAVGVEVAAITATRVSGSRCGNVFDGDATTLRFGPETVYCAVRWISRPTGLTNASPSPTLTGRFATLATFNGEYETGVMWTHPVTKQVAFAKSGQHQISVPTQLPIAPTITFLPDRLLVKAGAPNPQTFAGTALAGGVQVSSPYAGLHVKVFPDEGETVDATSTSSRFFRATVFNDSVVGTPRTLRVEANYPAAPDVVYTKDFTFDVVPRRQMLSIATPPVAISTSPLTIEAKFGAMVSATDFAYDAATQGQWSIQLATVDGKGTLTPVGAPVTNIGADGALTFNVGMLAPGLRTFTALATQTDAPAGTTNTVRGRNLAVIVRNGSPVPVYNVTTPTAGNGPSPFTAQLGVLPVTRDRLIDIGEVRYDVSDDGTAYTPLLKTDGSPMAGALMLFISQTLTGNSQKYVRATLKNRWSGVETVASATELQSFVVPEIAIQSPRYTFVEHPITVNSVVADIDPATLAFKWTVRYGKYDPAPTVTEGGTTLPITPVKAGDLIVELEAKDANAPDNTRAVRKASVVVHVLPPVLARPTVAGPTVVETGQNYTWTGNQKSPFPAGTVTDLVVRSQWVLPDGTTSTDNPVNYLYKDGDVGKVRFESWVEGYPTSLIATDYVLKPWSYEWPAMKVVAGVVNAYAPARIQFNAGLVDQRLLASLHGEPLSYDWVLPGGATLVSQNAGVLVAEFPNPGTFKTTVTISDTRGNSSTVESQSFVIQPPKPLTFNLTLGSGDRFNRPPGPIVARTAVTSLPSGDQVRGVTFFINDVQAGPEVLSGANFNTPDPGTYAVRAVMRSVKGVTAEVTQNITLTTGDNPACTITKNGDGVNALWFAASCRVQRGLITKYRWKVNGQETSVTATTFQQTKAYIPSTASVEVTATTDMGQVGGAIFTMSTGQSTPTP